MASPRVADTVKTFGLVLLSLIFLPFSSLILCISYTTGLFHRTPRLKHDLLNEPEAVNGGPILRPPPSRTILVTGVGMAKGLALARSFHLSHHRVIGADFERNGIPAPGRYSKSLAAFYSMDQPESEGTNAKYAMRLLHIIKRENVDLWVSCSGVASATLDAEAKEAIEAKTPCRCIQFGVAKTEKLHGKDTFIGAATRLGLPVPETFEIRTKRDALEIISGLSGKASASATASKYVLKPVGVDDAARSKMMTLLPLSTHTQTNAYIHRLAISPAQPMILQQYIPSGEEYCSHALVVDGEVRVFAACRSTDILMAYEPLPRKSALFKAMLMFTREFTRRSRAKEPWTGHLSFDFMVQDAGHSEKGIERSLWAIECNPRAHTAVVMFGCEDGGGEAREAMVRAYLSALPSKGGKQIMVDGVDGQADKYKLVVPPPDSTPRYWAGHDLVALGLMPLLNLVQGRSGLWQVAQSWAEMLTHMFTWKEGTFDLWDPMPAFVLYHVYWPLTLLAAWWRGERWSRLNVSTNKMFTC